MAITLTYYIVNYQGHLHVCVLRNAEYMDTAKSHVKFSVKFFWLWPLKSLKFEFFTAVRCYQRESETELESVIPSFL